ncbi:hypothetical protein Tco_0099098 [Tanacetum coccineum]
MGAEIPQTLEYRGGQLNVASLLEVEKFTNWKKMFICHIIGIKPQLKNIILNCLYVPMTAGVWKPKAQWTNNERKAANPDQRLKCLIMYVLPDDQMNYFNNCEKEKSTWEDLILSHEGPSDVKENRVMDLKLCYNTFRFKEGETLTQTFTKYKALMNKQVNDGIKLSKLEINTGFINGLPKKWLRFCQSLRNANHDEEKVSLDENEMVEVKVLRTLADDESGVVGKESAKNDKWVKISIRKDSNVSKLNVERPWLSKAEGFNLTNYDTSRILSTESHVNVTDSLVTVNVTDSLVIDYDSAKESTLVCSTLLPLLEKLPGAEPQTELQPGPKTIKSILKACSTRKAETSKDVVINETINSSPPTKGTKNVSASKWNSAPSSKLKNVRIKDDIPMSVALRWYLEMTLPAPLKNMVLLNVMFDEKNGIIFNSNKEVVMIAPRLVDERNVEDDIEVLFSNRTRYDWILHINYPDMTSRNYILSLHGQQRSFELAECLRMLHILALSGHVEVYRF